MASRKISIVFAVEGEKEYKTAIANINRELKTLQTDLALVQSQFKGNLNSQEAITEQLKVLNAQHEKLTEKLTTEQTAYENCERAVAQYTQEAAELAAKLAQAQSTLSSFDSTIDKTSDAYKDAKKAVDDIQASITKNNDALNAAKSGMDNHQQAANKTQIAINELNYEIAEQTKYLDEAANSSDHCATSIDEMGNKTDAFKQKTENAFQVAATAIASAGLERIYSGITDAMLSCVESAAKFETAITGVYKTVDGTEEQLNEITQAIKDLATEIPLTTTEIAGIAEAAGQLGIATEDIMSFTETIAALSVSTNLSADEAATAIAKFANITSMAAENYSNFGATLVDLGNNLAATETEILNMATKMASAGTQIGLSESEILGFAGALSSLGMEAEAGGSAFSTAVKRIQLAVESSDDSLAQYAEVAGMTADAFRDLWSSDTSAAITAFIEGLSGVDAESESTITMLDEIGFSSIRLSDAWTRLASNSGLVTEAVDLANEAWGENTALTEEASKFYETFESKVQTLENAFDNLKTAFGDQIKDTIEPYVDSLSDATQAMADFAGEHPEFVTAITTIGGALATFVGTLSASAAAITVINGIKTALEGLGTAGTLLTTGGGLVALAVLLTGITVAVAEMKEQAEETSKAYQNLSGEVRTAYEVLKDTLENDDIEITTAQKLEKVNETLDAAIAKKAELEELLKSASGKDAYELTVGIDSLDDMIADLTEWQSILGGVSDQSGDTTLSTEELTAALAEEAEQAQETAEELEALKEEQSDLEDGVQDLYDAVQTALKNQYKEQYEATKDYIEEVYDAEVEASENRLEIYEEEHDQKIKWLEDYTDKVNEGLNAEIDAIKALTDAENEAQELEDFDKKIKGYDENISEQTADVRTYSGTSTVLDDYAKQAADLAEKYNQQIATNQAEGLIKVEEAQQALQQVTEDTAKALAALNKDSEEYATAEYESAQKIAEAEKAVQMAKLSVEETEYSLLRDRYKEEITLAEQKGDALEQAMAEAYQAQLAEAEATYNKELEAANKLEESKREAAKETAKENYEDAKEAAEDTYEAAVKSANKLYDYEEKRADALSDRMQTNVKTVRDKEIDAIEEEMDALEEAADTVQESWDDAYEAQKKHEEELQKQAQATRDANLEAAKANYDSLTDSLALAEETVRILKEASEEDLVTILDKYNSDFALSSQTAAQQVVNGVGTTAIAVSEAVGVSVTDTLAKIQELQNKIDELEGTDVEVTVKGGTTTEGTSGSGSSTTTNSGTKFVDPDEAIKNITEASKTALSEIADTEITKLTNKLSDSLDLITNRSGQSIGDSVSVSNSSSSNMTVNLNIGEYNTSTTPETSLDKLAQKLTQLQKRGAATK